MPKEKNSEKPKKAPMKLTKKGFQKTENKTEFEKVCEYLISKGARELTDEERKEESYIKFLKELQAEERKNFHHDKLNTQHNIC